MKIALLRYSIQIGFCRYSLGFELFWFLDSKRFSYPPNCFAARPELLLYDLSGLRAILSALGSKIVFKVVFFGVLRFLSSMRSVVSGTLQIERVFHVMFIQHRTIRHFSACCLQMKAD